MSQAAPRSGSRPWGLLAAIAAVAAVLMLGVLVAQRALAAQADGIAVMNVSGRQRMLSQRIAALALQIGRAPDEQGRIERLGELRLTADVMERSLDALAHGGLVPALDGSSSGIVLDGRLSPALRAHYYEAPANLDRRLRTLAAEARAVADALAPQPDAAPADVVPGTRLDALAAEAQGPVLTVLDQAVDLRQRQQIDTLRRLQYLSVAAFGVLALALAALVRGRSRRRAREASARARQAAAERFEFLLAGSSDVILVMDADTTIRYVSPAVNRVFGYAEGDLVGTSAISLVHPDELARAADTLAEVVAQSGSRHETTSWRLRRADGMWCDAEMSSNNLIDDPRVGGIVVNIRDVTHLRAAERARAEEHAFIGAVVNTVAALVVVLTPDGRIVRLNRAAEQLCGYRTDEVYGQHFGRFVPPDELAALEVAAVRPDGSMYPPDSTNHWVTRSGERRLISWTNTELLDAEGNLAHIIGTGLDVTDSRRAEQERRQAEERFRLVFDHAPVGFALAALDGRLLSANAALGLLVGRSLEELIGADLRSLLPGGGHSPEGPTTEPLPSEDCVSGGADAVGELLEAVGRGTQARGTAELPLVRPDGSQARLALGLTVVRDHQGQPLHFVAQLEDVTARHEAERELEHRALHDALTGLPNRVLFLDRLAQTTARLRTTGASVALLYLDLDGFKAVNDTYGHAAGDDLLRVVAERLRSAVRPVDTVARLGGDEFAVLCDDVVDDRHADMVAVRLRTELERPIDVAGTTVAVGASIGRVVVGRGRHDPAELLARADAAMYAAKQGARRSLDRAGPAAAAPPAVPVDEAARLASLRSYRVLDSPREEVFDDLVRLAAMICETPIAAISLIDDERQWFKASVGLSVAETPRELAFCVHALSAEDLIVVDDTRTDDRFRHHPGVLREPALRFYGAAPLRTDDHHVLGTLCVVDTVPRRLRPDQEEALRALGRQVMFHLEQRRRALAATAEGAGG